MPNIKSQKDRVVQAVADFINDLKQWSYIYA